MSESVGNARRVLLVEDEPSIAEPFAQALARNGFEPVIARTAGEALRLAREAEPDVVLLDLTLPDGDGRDVCRELRRVSDVPIIMLTARGTVTDRVVGLELGADDYVVKPFAVGEVISRIRAVLRRARGAPRAPPIADRAASCGSTSGRAARGSADAELELTRKEFDLLARLARDAGSVVSRETLMSEVWDENWFGSTKTLDVHIAGLRRKLGDEPAAPRYIQTVRGVGFRCAATGSRSRRTGACASGRGCWRRSPTCCCWRSSRSACRSRSSLQRARQRRGALAGAGTGRPGRGDRRRPARAGAPQRARGARPHLRGRGARAGARRRSLRDRARRQRRSARARRQLRGAAGDRERACAAARCRCSARAARSGEEILATAVPIIRNGATVGAVRVTQSVAAVHAAVRRVELGLALIGAIVLALGLAVGAVIAGADRAAAGPPGARRQPRRRRRSRAPARRSRAAASSARSGRRSTR